MLRKEKGITLVALVITVIVLLILAGVSITALTGENSIIRRAQQASNAYGEDEGKTQNNLNTATSVMDEVLSNTKYKYLSK